MRNELVALRRDWQRWSKAERAAAVAILILVVALAVVFPLLGRS